MSIFKIGHREIGIQYPTYVIAEAGINHNGNLEIAKHMKKIPSHGFKGK